MAAQEVYAGCGCDKPPPPPAAIRPHAATSGSPLTLFHSALVVGRTYVVAFRPAAGGGAAVTTQAVSRRDLADGTTKAQLVVALPDLPLGPTAVDVYTQEPSDQPLISLGDAALTVVPMALRLPDAYGVARQDGYRAAIGRDGTAYVALDLSGLTQPMVFEAQAKGYPLRFDGGDVVFYNAQGFLMQRLVDVGSAEPVPGMFILPASNAAADSDVLHYSRHEFSTYFLQHEERQRHSVSDDPNWHRDGTPHIDHDHLILALSGYASGKAPVAGATPPFTLEITTRSLFSRGLVGADALTVDNAAIVDSYDRATGRAACNGDVASNGTVALLNNAVVCGDATSAQLTVGRRAVLRGAAYRVTEPTTFMDVAVPAGIKDLGSVRVLLNQRAQIRGPGSFKVRDLSVSALGRLHIDNREGPVTLYVTGTVSVALTGVITTAVADPEQFAIYVAGDNPVRIFGLGSERFHGVIYAPYSTVDLDSGDFYGAFVAGDLRAGGSARIHYDESLRNAVDLGVESTDGDFVTRKNEGLLGGLLGVVGSLPLGLN